MTTPTPTTTTARPSALAVLLWALAAGCSPASPPQDGGADADDATAQGCPDPSTELGGELRESRTLYRACSPYRLADSLGVYGAGVTLTVEAGVEIHAAAGRTLAFEQGARLLAQGTADAPVLIRAEDAARAAGWKGIALRGGAGGAAVTHELHHVVLRDGGSSDGGTWVSGVDNAVIWVARASGESRALLDHVTIEGSKSVGLHVYREGASLAPGSNAIAVRGAASYPAIFDAQNLGSLPARQTFESTDPERNRILVFGGEGGTVLGDHTWAVQGVPFEVAARLSIGDDATPGSLRIEAPAALRFHRVVSFDMANGALHAEGTAAEPITIDWAVEGEHWGGLHFAARGTNVRSHASRLTYVTARHGGNPTVTIHGPGSAGTAGDCTPGPEIANCTFADPLPSSGGGAVYCLQASDHSRPYATANRYMGVGCVADVQCD